MRTVKLSIALLATTLVALAQPVAAVPVFPEGHTLYTIRHDSTGPTQLGIINSDGSVTPVGDPDLTVDDIRDADYNPVTGMTYALSDLDPTCAIYTIDLETGEFTLATTLAEIPNYGTIVSCDALAVAEDFNGIAVSVTVDIGGGESASGLLALSADTFAVDSSMATDVEYKAIEYVPSSTSDPAGGQFLFWAADGAHPQSFIGFGNGATVNGDPTTQANIQSVTLAFDNTSLWYTNWSDSGVEVGHIEAGTGVADVWVTDLVDSTDSARWGTNAIFFYITPENAANSGGTSGGGLASTGFDAGWAVGWGVLTMSAGAALVAFRRRVKN